VVGAERDTAANSVAGLSAQLAEKEGHTKIAPVPVPIVQNHAGARRPSVGTGEPPVIRQRDALGEPATISKNE
jgi:hypothetical protein